MNWQMLKDSFNLKHNNKIKHVLHPAPAEHTIPNARTTALIPAQQKPQSLTSNKDTSVTAPHLRNETRGGRGKGKAEGNPEREHTSHTGLATRTNTASILHLHWIQNTELCDRGLRLKDSQNQRSQNRFPFGTNQSCRNRTALPVTEIKHALLLRGTVLP